MLLSCDLFGSHLATSELFGTGGGGPARGKALLRRDHDAAPALRCRKNLEKVEALKIDAIAPSHGPLYARPSGRSWMPIESGWTGPRATWW